MRNAASVSIAGYEIIDSQGALTGEGIGVIVFLVLVIGVVAWTFISNTINKKKGADSQEKNRIKEIINEVVQNGESVTVAYANWTSIEYAYKEGKKIYKYWWYAVGFNTDRIYMVPLRITKEGQISYDKHFCIEKSELGMVNAKENDNWIELYDKNKEKIVSLRVEKSNTKDTKGCLVNIQQPEEEQAWIAFVNRWLDEVNRANGVKPSGRHALLES